MVYGAGRPAAHPAAADPRDVQRLHRTARALRDRVAGRAALPRLHPDARPAQPRHAAMVDACARLLRGSGYVAFDGEMPAQPQHSALASEYAHVTAPLRRLGDRYAGEVCLALCAGHRVPAWVRAALPGLPRDPVRVRPARPAPTSARSSTWSRRACSPAGSARSSTGVIVDVDDKDQRRGVVDSTTPTSRPGCPRVGPAARHRRPGAARGRRRGGPKVEFTLRA